MIIMYKVILLIVCTLLIPVQVLAVTPRDRDVSFTVHNLSYNPSNSAIGITDADRNYSTYNPGANQVCIFCHTPHNASPSVPLWNKYIDPGMENVYRLYTSSSTLTSVAKGAKVTAGSDSMLCLSCHDGKTAINVIHNSRVNNGTVGNDFIIDMSSGNDGFTGTSVPWAMGDIGTLTYPSNLGATRKADGTILDAKAGTNLTDDHPIGFSYTDAWALKTNALHDLPTATTKINGFGVRFFGPTNRLECGSCHDPHMYYGYGKVGGSPSQFAMPSATPQQLARRPFLVRDNNGSALCLACHIK